MRILYYFSIFGVKLKKKILKLTHIILPCLIIIFSACEKLPNDGIPSYIKIANPSIETTPSQGAAMATFSDLWLEAQGKDLGAYEHPTIFGAYIAGQQDITVNAGIFYNGNTSDRRIYDALDPYEANINFIQKDTTLIEPTFKYKQSVDFIFIEDFEATNNFSEMTRTDLSNAANKTGRAGVIILEENENSKTSESISAININEGQRVYLEMSVNSQNYGVFGIQSVSDPSNFAKIGSFAPYGWIHTYFNITSVINTLKEGQYKFYISVQREDIVGESKTYIDNFKILQF